MQIGVWQSGDYLFFVLAPVRWQEKSCNFYVWDGRAKRAQLCHGDPNHIAVIHGLGLHGIAFGRGFS